VIHSWLKMRIVQALLACIALLTLCLGYERWQHVHWRDFGQAVIAARKAATIQQVQINHEPARQSKVLAENSNAQAPTYYTSVHAAADAHAIRLRDHSSSIGGANLRSTDPVEPSIHGSIVDPKQSEADLVCRPSVEDHWLVSAAGRAAEMFQQTQDLITLGVVEAEPKVEQK
jgi:hypothetical protein